MNSLIFLPWIIREFNRKDAKNIGIRAISQMSENHFFIESVLCFRDIFIPETPELGCHLFDLMI
jgi:hypothetical protein